MLTRLLALVLLFAAAAASATAGNGALFPGVPTPPAHLNAGPAACVEVPASYGWARIGGHAFALYDEADLALAVVEVPDCDVPALAEGDDFTPAPTLCPGREVLIHGRTCRVSAVHLLGQWGR